MAVRVVRLGSPRARGEGLRIGTVRRPPRGVPRAEFASRDFYDVWLPDLAPSDATVALAHRAATERDWAAFARRYRAEMAAPGPRRTLDLLAALSHGADFAVGCYCEEERHCHRAVLRALLAERGARFAPGGPPAAPRGVSGGPGGRASRRSSRRAGGSTGS